MYSHLKTEFPTHGLEIIFVSGEEHLDDFDNQSNHNFMPWLAVPLDNENKRKELRER